VQRVALSLFLIKAQRKTLFPNQLVLLQVFQVCPFGRAEGCWLDGFFLESFGDLFPQRPIRRNGAGDEAGYVARKLVENNRGEQHQGNDAQKQPAAKVAQLLAEKSSHQSAQQSRNHMLGNTILIPGRAEIHHLTPGRTIKLSESRKREKQHQTEQPRLYFEQAFHDLPS